MAAKKGETRKTPKRKAKTAKSLEQTLWDAADKLRGNLESSEYKHVVLGLVFLKYVSDAFKNRRLELEGAVADPKSKDFIKNPESRDRIVESRDEYLSQNVFWVPESARWEELQAKAKLPEIGQLIDDAMDVVEKENPSLKGVLPKNYGRADLDKRLLGELVDLIGSIGFTDVDHGSDDVLGKVYEYFLGKFAGQEGRGAGEFYTPRSVVKLLVEMLEPYKGRVYDPACGSGGMFVQSAEFVAAHGGKRDDISIFGQEFVGATWKLAKMNLALRGIDANLGDRSDDSFHRDLHPDLRADFVLANPPFNKDDWFSEALADDPRWKFGRPPAANANFAWVQHFVHHLAPSGTAGFVLANGSLSSKTSGEGAIRQKLIEADLVDCVVALPGRLFLNTGIPVCLWFLSKNRHGNGQRKRTGETLFMDARKLGTMETRTFMVLSEDDITRIAGTYHAWRGSQAKSAYEDVPGFARSASLDEIIAGDYVLTPGRYVRAAARDADSEQPSERIERLQGRLFDELEEDERLNQVIRDRLTALRR
jgi:type I restriction enzyme M protein